MMRRIVATGAALALAAGTVAACGSDADDAAKALRAYAAAWQDGKLDTVAYAGSGTNDVLAQYRQITAALVGLDAGSSDSSKPPAKPAKVEAGQVKLDGDAGTGQTNVTWSLGGATWAYQSTVKLEKRDGKWRIGWTPSAVHPKLNAGEHLGMARTQAERGAITDAAGQPVFTKQKLVSVGLEPQKTQPPAEVVGKIATALKKVGITLDTADVLKRLGAAKPDAFVPVITLRRPQYDQIRADIHDLAGATFNESERMVPLTATFARALLGNVDAVTEEMVTANPGVYGAADLAGHGGLQQQYEARLRGVPGYAVTVDKSGESLWKTEAKAGTPVKTSLDVKAQNAADGALSTETRPSALVAVRISDGTVAAASNGPGATYNLAFTGKVAPGSTFKMVTAYGLLDSGALTPDTPVACPATVTVEGRTFKNAWNGGIDGNPPFHTDFAKSCNTAFINSAPKLGDDGLAKAAGALGIGGKWEVGTEAVAGSVGTGGSAVDKAAASFGQGTTAVSPLAMAAATAAVAHGQWQQPKVVLDPAPPAAPPGPQLKPQVTGALKTMMREVVTAGTATNLAGAPGGEVYAKTGTAEFGSGDPPPAHGWVLGWQGDYAFAVFIEGANTSAPAVDAAKRFLTALRS